MGGRGREYKQSEQWSWVGELSNERLDNYGKMSWHHIDESHGKDALNYECANEFERRHGYRPDWESKRIR